MDRFDWSDLPEKSLWQERPSKIWSFYCPLCKTPRKLPYRPKPGGFQQVAQIGLTTAFVTLLTWPWFSFKGVIVGIPLWIAFETFYRMRVRASVVCQYCGFDPFLYLIDVKKARAEVEAHWRKVFAEKGIPYPEKGKPGAAPKAARGDAETAAETAASEAQKSPEMNP